MLEITNHLPMMKLHKLAQRYDREFAKKEYFKEKFNKQIEIVASLRNKLFSFFAGERVNLTSRERQVYDLMTTGISNKEIAMMLAISERTVKYHVGKILKATHRTSRHQFFADRK